MINGNSAARDALIDRLNEHVGELEFIYGEPITGGDAQITVMMTLAEDELLRPCYVGSICAVPRPGAESEGLPWAIVNDRGDTIDCGRTGPRGVFQVPINLDLSRLKVRCKLRVARPELVDPRRPEIVWERAPRLAMAAGMEARPGIQGGRILRVRGGRLKVSVPARDVPFGLVAVAAISRGRIARSILLVMPLDAEDRTLRQNSLEIRDLVDLAEADAYQYDAWPVTTDARSRMEFSLKDFQALLSDPLVAENREVRDQLDRLIAGIQDQA